MKVISLFDGISCGRVALERAGISVEHYAAFEIEEHAIAVGERNWGGQYYHHYGDVITADFTMFKDYDLLIGGSPCQALSTANVYLKDGEYGVNGEGKSRLFWEFVRAYKTIQPKWFLYENVASMKKEDKNIITKELGVEPVLINSILFSGQVRRRLYWTNIPFDVPNERMVDIELKDILEPSVPDWYYLKAGTVGYITRRNDKWVSKKMEINPQYGRPVVASCWKIHRADTDSYVSTEYCPEGRTNIRRLTPTECERLQTLPDGYTIWTDDDISLAKMNRYRYEMIGNGWTVDVISHILKGIVKTESEVTEYRGSTYYLYNFNIYDAELNIFISEASNGFLDLFEYFEYFETAQN